MIGSYLDGFVFAIGVATGGVFVLFAVVGFIYLCDYISGMFK